MMLLMLLFASLVVAWLLWLANKWGLGKGGELLFTVCVYGGAVLRADKLDLGLLGIVIFVLGRSLVAQVSEIQS